MTDIRDLVAAFRSSARFPVLIAVIRGLVAAGRSNARKATTRVRDRSAPVGHNGALDDLAASRRQRCPLTSG
jgi:hypothetical protein